MKIKSIVVALSTLWVLGHQPAAAQPAPVDTAGVILELARGLQARGFVDDAERLFELIRKLYPDSRAAQLSAQALSTEKQFSASSGGRTELIVWSTFYGASLGVILPAALGAESPEPYGIGLLVGAPVGYGLSTAYANRHPVSPGQARLMTFGSWWGAFQGMGWREVLDIGDSIQQHCFPTEEDIECFDFRVESDRAPYTASLIGGLAGMAAGTYIGRNRPITASTALVTNLAAIWGSWFGLVIGEQIDVEQDQFFNNDEDETALTTVLIAGNVGLLAGALAAPGIGWSTRQAWTVHLAGITGVIGGFGIALLANVDDAETALLIPGVTSAATLVASSALVRGKSSGSAQNHRTSMSLVDFADGQWSLGLPTPVPTVVEAVRDGKWERAPAAKVSLVRMVF